MQVLLYALHLTKPTLVLNLMNIKHQMVKVKNPLAVACCQIYFI